MERLIKTFHINHVIFEQEREESIEMKNFYSWFFDDFVLMQEQSFEKMPLIPKHSLFQVVSQELLQN
jgi:hypothetical protein